MGLHDAERVEEPERGGFRSGQVVEPDLEVFEVRSAELGVQRELHQLRAEHTGGDQRGQTDAVGQIPVVTHLSRRDVEAEDRAAAQAGDDVERDVVPLEVLEERDERRARSAATAERDPHLPIRDRPRPAVEALGDRRLRVAGIGLVEIEPDAAEVAAKPHVDGARLRTRVGGIDVLPRPDIQRRQIAPQSGAEPAASALVRVVQHHGGHDRREVRPVSAAGIPGAGAQKLEDTPRRTEPASGPGKVDDAMERLLESRPPRRMERPGIVGIVGREAHDVPGDVVRTGQLAARLSERRQDRRRFIRQPGRRDGECGLVETHRLPRPSVVPPLESDAVRVERRDPDRLGEVGCRASECPGE